MAGVPAALWLSELEFAPKSAGQSPAVGGQAAAVSRRHVRPIIRINPARDPTGDREPYPSPPALVPAAEQRSSLTRVAGSAGSGKQTTACPGPGASELLARAVLSTALELQVRAEDTTQT